MVNCIIIISILIFFLFCMFCMVWIIGWSISKEGLKIKFKQFISMYQMAPGKWYLYDDGTVSYEKSKYSIQYFYFSPIDYLRYFAFLKGRHKRKTEQQWLEIVKMWQNDIGEFQNGYIKELQNKIKDI